MKGARLAGLALLLVVATGAGGRSEAPAVPLTDEDVVRMVASGRSADEIVRLVESSAVRFDLSDEMIAELRLAGVPERVVAAMRARQERETPAASRPAEPASEDRRPELRVVLSTGRDGRKAIWAPDRLDDPTARALQVGSGPEERRVGGVALFVACTTPDHVPDQWRSSSPLGRDFVSMPRHELLALHTGALRVPASDVPRSMRSAFRRRGDEADPGWLRLDLPAELGARVSPAVAHDLVVGVAWLVGDRYLVVARDERSDVQVEPAGRTIRGSVTGDPSGSAGLRVTLAKDDAPGESP